MEDDEDPATWFCNSWQFHSVITVQFRLSAVSYRYLQGVAVEPVESEKICFGPGGGHGSKAHKTDLRPVDKASTHNRGNILFTSVSLKAPTRIMTLTCDDYFRVQVAEAAEGFVVNTVKVI